MRSSAQNVSENKSKQWDITWFWSWKEKQSIFSDTLSGTSKIYKPTSKMDIHITHEKHHLITCKYKFFLERSNYVSDSNFCLRFKCSDHRYFGSIFSRVYWNLLIAFHHMCRKHYMEQYRSTWISERVQFWFSHNDYHSVLWQRF